MNNKLTRWKKSILKNPLPPSSSRNSTAHQDVTGCIFFCSPLNARMSGDECTWTWTHQKFGVRRHEFDLESGNKSLEIYAFGLGWSGHIRLRTHEKRTKSFERTIVLTYALSVSDGLDIDTFRLGRSGHRHFPSGTVWTYGLSVGHLNLGLENHRRKKQLFTESFKGKIAGNYSTSIVKPLSIVHPL